MLILSRKKEESIIIDGRISISIVDIKGDQVKLGIDAPREVKIHREEVYKAIQEENRLAAKSAANLPDLGSLMNPK